MSGAGKSLTVDVLEDMGYYSIDNMPVFLIPNFLELFSSAHTEYTRVAFVIDSRGGRQDFQPLFKALTDLREKGDKVKIITPAAVTVSTLSSDNINYDALEPTATSLVIDQKKFFAFKIDDVAQVQSNTSIMEAHLTNAKKAIEEVQDSYLLAQHAYVDEKNIVGSEEAPVELDKSTIYEHFVKLALCLKNEEVYICHWQIALIQSCKHLLHSYCTATVYHKKRNKSKSSK